MSKTIKLSSDLPTLFVDKNKRRTIISAVTRGELIFEGVDVDVLKRVLAELRSEKTHG